MVVLSSIPATLAYGATSPEESATVRRWDVVEIALRYAGELENPFQDVEAVCRATGPDGQMCKFDGFYDGDATWRFRFVPDAHGKWSLHAQLAHDGKVVAEAGKDFTAAGDLNHGFVRVSSVNPYALEWQDGRPYYPIGIQPGGIEGGGVDGPPKGSGEWRHLPLDEYIDAFRGKANLFRMQLGLGGLQPHEMLLTGEEGLYRYDVEYARKLDKSLRTYRKNGFAVILVPFQDMSVWRGYENVFGDVRDPGGFKNVSNENIPAIKAYLRYVTARYSAYTDIWQIFNEDCYTPNDWLRVMAAHIRDLDPYDHPIATSYERPLEPWCDIVTPHEYMQGNYMDELEIDAHLCRELLRAKSYGKPVLYTEFGNGNLMPNEDPVKWRIAVWVAHMNECHLTFWHMGGISVQAGPDSNANAYLGKRARDYFEAFHKIVDDLPVDMRPVLTGWDQVGQSLWRYALGNGRLTLFYAHHMGDHSKAHPPADETIIWTGAGNFRITWLDPATAEVLHVEEKRAGGEALFVSTPPVVVDVAALIERIDP
jgi:hypothetical protein